MWRDGDAAANMVFLSFPTRRLSLTVFRLCTITVAQMANLWQLNRRRSTIAIPGVVPVAIRYSLVPIIRVGVCYGIVHVSFGKCILNVCHTKVSWHSYHF